MMIMIIIIDTASDNIKDEFLFKPIEKQYKSEKKKKTPAMMSKNSPNKNK